MRTRRCTLYCRVAVAPKNGNTIKKKRFAFWQISTYKIYYIIVQSKRSILLLPFVLHLISSLFYFVKSSAICTALVAAPFLTWSPQHQSVIPFSQIRSLRILPTKTRSWSLVTIGIGYILFAPSS